LTFAPYKNIGLDDMFTPKVIQIDFIYTILCKVAIHHRHIMLFNLIVIVIFNWNLNEDLFMEEVEGFEVAQKGDTKGKLGLEIGLKQFPKAWNEHSTIFGPNMNWIMPIII